MVLCVQTHSLFLLQLFTSLILINIHLILFLFSFLYNGTSDYLKVYYELTHFVEISKEISRMITKIPVFGIAHNNFILFIHVSDTRA